MNIFSKSTLSPTVETRLDMQAALYPTLKHLVRFLPWNHHQITRYFQEELRHNPFIAESLKIEGNHDPLLKDVQPEWCGSTASGISLLEHLEGQLSVWSLLPRQREAVHHLFFWLSPSGFLEGNAVEWAIGTEWQPYELESAAAILQRFDPPGIGARNLQECLSLQIQSSDKETPDWLRNLARALVEDYLDGVANCLDCTAEAIADARSLLETLRAQSQPDLTLNDLTTALTWIQALESRPARHFEVSPPPIVVPDLQAEPQPNGDWQVSLTSEIDQRFHLNPEAIDRLERSDSQSSQSQRLQELLQNARHLFTALRQWQENVLKIGEFLVHRQQVFLHSQNALDLVPTPQQLVSQTLELSNATVSRVVRDRFLRLCLSPERTIALQTLCTAVSVGGRTPQQIQHWIKEIIENESPTKPYSDEQISQLLKLRLNLSIARRTVAKYRQMAGLAPANSRHSRR